MLDRNSLIAKKEEKLSRLREQLARIDESYNRALLAQSWKSSDGTSERSVTNAKVSDIYRQKCELEAKIERLEAEIDGTRCYVMRIGVMR